MKVRIIQHLCPQRHAIMALAYVAANGQEDPAQIETLREVEALLRIDPWCGLCRSRQLFFEDRGTDFKSIEEAESQMREMEAANAATRAYLDASKG